MPAKKAARYGEAAFDVLYLCTALTLGLVLLISAKTVVSEMFGLMALLLVAGDACHLVPRIQSAITGERERFLKRLGYGKLAASVGMTVFYVLLWHIGLLAYSVKTAGTWTFIVYALAAVRAVLCLLPQNRWSEGREDGAWNIYRNIPFTLLGLAVGILFFLYRNAEPGGLPLMWLAILLSFAFYLPVVLFAEKRPALGMLMLPKSCAYVWIIVMGLSL